MPNPGMSPEIQEAMKRRQVGGTPTPALNQMSPGAAGAPQMPPPMPPSEMTKASAPQGAPTPSKPKFQPSNSRELIISTLVEELKNENKLTEQKTEMSSQPAPQAPPMPQSGVPMGGGSLSPGYEQPMPFNQMQGDYQNGLGRDYSGISNYGKGGF